MKNSPNQNSPNLTNGMDSGSVPERVKRQLLSDGLCICAAPDCNNRIDRQKTRLGECAHIIPRIVGSHPREDYQTPLEDRKKEANLLYLCEEHHKIIDNAEHASLYTAEVLKTWKRKHEEWAASVNKKSPYIPAEYHNNFHILMEQLAKQGNLAADILQKLLDTCRDLINQNKIEEARNLFAQIDILLLDSTNRDLNLYLNLLDVRLLIRTEKTHAAKLNLLNLIQENPSSVEPMLEYIELCDSAPEPDDESNRFESIARTLEPNHPRLLVIDLARKLRRREILKEDIALKQWSSDPYLNARIISLYVVLFDLSGNNEKRNEFLDYLEKEYPLSSKPHILKILFKANEVLKVGQNAKKQVFLEAIAFIAEEKEKISKKNLLSARDTIAIFANELLLKYAHSQRSGVDEDLNPLLDGVIALVGECYFDLFIGSVLLDLLINLRLKKEQWQIVLRQILGSGVIPSNALVKEIFVQGLQYDNITSGLHKLLIDNNQKNLLEILNALEATDFERAATAINAQKDSKFSLFLLQSLRDDNLALKLEERLEIDEEHVPDRLFIRLQLLSRTGRNDEAIRLIEALSLDNASPIALHVIEKIAFKNSRWDIFISAASKLVQFDIPAIYKTELNARLCIACHNQGDDTNAISYGVKALTNTEILGDTNSQNVLYILAKAYILKGQPDKACEAYEQHKHVKRSFGLLLSEADAYCKSTKANKYEHALSILLTAYRGLDKYEDKIFISAIVLVNELTNANIIPTESEASIEDGLFVKLEGLPDWLYLGKDDRAMGAVSVALGSQNYDALIHKSLDDLVEWPADKYSKPGLTRKILQIMSPPAYLGYRSHEAMMNLAKLGGEPIWEVKVINDDGSLDKENLKKFFNEVHKASDNFFDLYANTALPFAFLCKMEGGLVKAIGRIAAANNGFIRCNKANTNNFDDHSAAAREVLAGKPCAIDGLTALILVEADFLSAVIKAIPTLYVPTSVIRLLRKIASDIATSPGTVGRANIIDGNFQFEEINKDHENSFREKLLKAADLLDALSHKVTGKTYKREEGEKDLDYLLPPFFIDSFRTAQEFGAHLLSDDALLPEAYRLQGEQNIPTNFSSYSLIKEMVEAGHLRWKDYLKYFSILSSYRYHFLPITVDDLMKSVIQTSPSGLVTFEPKNLLCFRLNLTLAREYGVEDNVAASVLAQFFVKIILDDTIFEEAAEEVFSTTLAKTFHNRDAKVLSPIIWELCKRNIPPQWVSSTGKRKFSALENHLARYAFDIVMPHKLIFPTSGGHDG